MGPGQSTPKESSLLTYILPAFVLLGRFQTSHEEKGSDNVSRGTLVSIMFWDMFLKRNHFMALFFHMTFSQEIPS